MLRNTAGALRAPAPYEFLIEAQPFSSCINALLRVISTNNAPRKASAGTCGAQRGPVASGPGLFVLGGGGAGRGHAAGSPPHGPGEARQGPGEQRAAIPAPGSGRALAARPQEWRLKGAFGSSREGERRL